MARSTGPMLLVGGMEFANDYLNGGGIQVKVLLATGIAAGGLALAEQIPGAAPLAVGIAWIAFVTLMFTSIGGKPSPVQTIQKVTGLLWAAEAELPRSPLRSSPWAWLPRLSCRDGRRRRYSRRAARCSTAPSARPFRAETWQPPPGPRAPARLLVRG